jgi:predicted pyridoxine 5'-phosphate oxidase superfamily flavin-nucleotide-binding protein
MLSLDELGHCFEGIVPATLATAAADGTPNVTRISKVHHVDAEHVAISNQFLSKTQRNLAENPTGSLIVIDPLTYESYKLLITFERAEKRGPLFDRMHRDVEAIAALTGMSGIFRLRSVDVYRVTEVERERG